MSSGKNELVSIILLNWNGIGFTKECINSIRRNTSYKPFETLVVDNGSSSEEVAELRAMEKKGLIGRLILNEENRGFSGGNNQGIRAAKGNYIILLNNDTLVERNWLAALKAVADARPEIGVVGPNIVSQDKQDVTLGGGFVDDRGSARHSFNASQGEAEQVGGAALFFKRKLLDDIGCLDEGFNPIYFEETDFCARARKAGFKVVFTPKSRIIHLESAAMKKQPSKAQFVTVHKNRVRYMLLHFPKTRLLKASFWEALRLGRSTLQLRPHWLLHAYAVNARNLHEILGKRKRYSKGDLKP